MAPLGPVSRSISAMRTLTLSVALAATLLGACKKKDKEPAPAPAPTTGPAAGSAGSAAPTPTPAAGTAAPAPTPTAVDPAMANKAGNCPAAVAGATAELVDDPAAAGAVVLAISAKDPAAVETIRKRAAHLATIQAAPDADIKHGGEGTGGGAGMCPVVTTRDVKVAVTETPEGVRVAMTPSGGMTAADLAKEVATRIDKMETYADFAKGGGGGAGGGSGDHGGNHSGQGDGKGKTRDGAKPALGGT